MSHGTTICLWSIDKPTPPYTSRNDGVTRAIAPASRRPRRLRRRTDQVCPLTPGPVPSGVPSPHAWRRPWVSPPHNQAINWLLRVPSAVSRQSGHTRPFVIGYVRLFVLSPVRLFVISDVRLFVLGVYGDESAL